MNRACYEIVREVRIADAVGGGSHTVVTLRDLGPWDTRRTVTNDAEAVIADLIAAGKIREDGDEVFCYDSEGDLAKLLVEGGAFAGFGFLPA